jgi:DNA (cytosine-5)-methyltransferase 1
LWQGHRITAIEINPQIAEIYQKLYPDDTVIVTDAHEYLANHYQKFDFIWSSPPCPSHSKLRKYLSVNAGGVKAIYPDMKLYEEILFLQGYFKGNWVVENVVSWYTPLIPPIKLGRHCFWSNYHIPQATFESINPALGNVSIKNDSIKVLQEKIGIYISIFKTNGIDKRLLLRNCVNPQIGNYIFNQQNIK